MVTTLASQGVSAVALLSIVLLGTTLSDSYALAIQVGTSAFSGVVLQVIYFVAIGRPWMRSWRLWSWLSVAFAVVFAGIVITFGVLAGDLDATTVVVVTVFAAGGVFLALAGVSAVRLACIGRPLLMVGMTIAPNAALAAASVFVGVTGLDSGIAVVTPAIAWAVTSLIVWIVCLRRPVPVAEEVEAQDGTREQAVQGATLGVGLIANTIYPTLFIAALATLPAGATTLLFLVSKIGTSLVGLFVNSVLAVRFNWRTETTSMATVAIAFTAASVTVGAIGSALALLGLDLAGTVVMAAAWFAALVATPLVVREIYARRLVRATIVKVLVDVLVTLSVGTWFLVSPSIQGFFGVYMAQQAGSLICCGVALRRPWLVVSAAALLILGVALVVFGD
jgi:hypothetical protein